VSIIYTRGCEDRTAMHKIGGQIWPRGLLTPAAPRRGYGVEAPVCGASACKRPTGAAGSRCCGVAVSRCRVPWCRGAPTKSCVKSCSRHPSWSARACELHLMRKCCISPDLAVLSTPGLLPCCLLQRRLSTCVSIKMQTLALLPRTHALPENA